MKKPIILFASLLFMMIHVTSWAQWQSVGSGIASSPRQIFSISAVNENVIWAVANHPTSLKSFDFTVSVDGGLTWNAGLLPDSIGNYYPGEIFALNDQVAWVLMISIPDQDKVRIFRTSDHGSSWHEQRGQFNTARFAFASLHFFNASDGIAFGSPGTGITFIDSLRIFRTSDGGDHWTRIPAQTLPAPLAGEGVWIYGDNRYESLGDSLWFVTRASRVFRTTDKGLTWQAFNAGISGNSNYPGLASIAFKNSMEGIVTTYFPSRAAVTIDGGETWMPLAMPSTPGAADIQFIPGTSGTYVINEGWLSSGNTSKFLLTHNSGNTWETTSYTPVIPVLRFLSPTIGFAGGAIFSKGSGGIYKWTGNFATSTTTIAQTNSMIDIYPNPLKDKMQFSFESNTMTSGSVAQILDYNGRKMIEKSITGNSGVMDLSGLPSGSYLLRIHSKDQIHLGTIAKQ
ncbi:MAG TPA: T9SS type A sorting domain-containing protein [Saprospiraceae bacterium]|nr:T9SS type A sorting domain-containing protein [Saprospiraceae bacterium]